MYINVESVIYFYLTLVRLSSLMFLVFPLLVSVVVGAVFLDMFWNEVIFMSDLKIVKLKNPTNIKCFNLLYTTIYTRCLQDCLENSRKY